MILAIDVGLFVVMITLSATYVWLSLRVRVCGWIGRIAGSIGLLLGYLVALAVVTVVWSVLAAPYATGGLEGMGYVLVPVFIAVAVAAVSLCTVLVVHVAGVLQALRPPGDTALPARDVPAALAKPVPPTLPRAAAWTLAAAAAIVALAEGNMAMEERMWTVFRPPLAPDGETAAVLLFLCGTILLVVSSAALFLRRAIAVTVPLGSLVCHMGIVPFVVPRIAQIRAELGPVPAAWVAFLAAVPLVLLLGIILFLRRVRGRGPAGRSPGDGAPRKAVADASRRD